MSGGVGTPSDAAKSMVGAWEISNAARDKTCPVAFSLDAGAGGFKIELDAACATVFPSLRDVVVWAMGPRDAVRLLDSKGVIILDFTEVEAHMYEAERKGEGLYFMRTQAAIKAETVTPEQVFGEWALLKEMDKPLCKLTLSNAAAGGESYKVTVKASNFATLVRDGINLAVGQSINLPLTLSITATQETVTVSAEAPNIETNRVERSTYIDSQSLKTLPTNGRNFLELAL